MSEYILYHHGVKGMKWGVRRYQNKDGSLTPAGKKRLEPLDSDSSVTKKVKNDYNTMTDQEFMNKYSTSKKTYAKRVEKHGDPYKHRKESSEKLEKVVTKGSKVARKLLLTSMVDDVFYGGAGKKLAKEAVVQTGRAAVTAYTMARGGYDIKWYDHHGNRVG